MCIRDRYTYGPIPGPDPCGKTVWLCNGTEYNSESDYKTTTCGTPPVVNNNRSKTEKVLKPNHCRNFKPFEFCGIWKSFPMDHYMCRCT